MKVRELVTKWGFEIDDKPLDRMKSKVEELKDVMKEISLKFVEAGAVLFELAHSTAEAGEKFSKLSDKTGLSVKTIQELAGAANLTGVDVDAFSQSLVIMNRKIQDARTGGAQGAKAFYQLGGGVSDLIKSGASSEEVFNAVATRLGDIADEGKRSALATEIFGRAGAANLPLLKLQASGINELRSKVEELGGVMSDEAVKQGEEFQKSLHSLMIVVTGVKNLVGGQLIPIVQDVMEKFSEWILTNKEFLKQNLTEFFKGLATFVKITWIWATKLAQAFFGLTKIFGGFNNVIKILLYSFSVFAGFQIVALIGEIAVAVVALVEGFMALSAAVAVTEAIALIIPALIGLAIVAVGLLLEDIYQFFQGNDSVIGLLAKWFQDTFPNLTKFLSGIFELVKSYVMLIITAFQGWWDIMVLIAGWFQDVFGPIIDYIANKITSFVGAIGKVAGFVGGLIGKGLNLAGEGLTALGVGAQNDLGAQGLGGLTPTDSPVTNNQGGNVNQQVSAPVSVVINGNADPHAVGSAVSQGVQQGLDGVLRPTGRAFAGGVAY